jgi:pilus assembly protein CpaE
VERNGGEQQALSGDRVMAGLRAILIAPNRALAAEFRGSVKASRVFEIVGDWEQYPEPRALERGVRQLRATVVLVDISADRQAAGELLRLGASQRWGVPVVALHTAQDPEAILWALRQGASEFLHAPFEPAAQQEAAQALLRLGAPVEAAERQGKVVAFSSVKPGAGATTLACHTALALKRLTGEEVLLADLDRTAGMVGFYLGIRSTPNAGDALAQVEALDTARWTTLTTPCRGVAVLPAPAAPPEAPFQPGRLEELLAAARRAFEWVILDLPAAFHRHSLQVLWSADTSFLVTTPDLASLYLARKAVRLLSSLGLTEERVRMLINRQVAAAELGPTELRKILEFPVHGSFPEGGDSVSQALATGSGLEPGSAMEQAIGEFVAGLAGVSGEVKRSGVSWGAGLALSGIRA